MGLLHYGICWTGLLTEYVYANILDNIFGMTVYVNISVIDTLGQADPLVPFVCSQHGVSGHQLTSNGSWCMGIKGEMSGTVCVTFTWDMYIYIYELFLLLFVHYCNLMVCVVYWVGKWQSRGSTGMFGNLMAIYHIMLQFIQNHSRFVMLMIWK